MTYFELKNVGPRANLRAHFYFIISALGLLSKTNVLNCYFKNGVKRAIQSPTNQSLFLMKVKCGSLLSKAGFE